MSISNALFTLSDTTPTQIVGYDNMPHQVMLHNMTKSSNEYIFIGDSSVSTANAPHIDPGETLVLELGPGDRLYAVSDPDGLEVGVLDIRKED
jgi:hypothetical protein